MSERPDLDRLGLLAARDRTQVRFGGTDVGPVMFGANLREAMSELPRADLSLRQRFARGVPIDYLAPVAIQMPSRRRSGPRFVGGVISARPGGEDIAVEVSGMPELTESRVGLFAAWNVPHQEHVYTLMRTAGLKHEQLRIEGLDSFPKQVFEVLVPIHGMTVDGRAEIDEVVVAPPDGVRSALRELTDEKDLLDPFQRADCVALCHATAALMHDAEHQAIAKIDAALGWLAVMLRYGFAYWPDGTPRHFERSEFRALPHRGEVSWVRGPATGRQWIRETGPVSDTPRLDLSPRHLDFQPPAAFSVQDHQAVAALRRVASTSDPIQAVTAVWDAIEFYVAGRPGPRLFDDATLKRLRKSVPKDLPTKLRGRAIDAINRLNQMPLLARLRAAAEEDGVPTTDDEWETLSRLRRSRNALVHGASPEAVPSASDLRRAQSLVARLLVHRAHRLAGD